MGGTGSGRWGGRPTVEGSRTLDIRELFRLGVLRMGVDLAHRWTWTDSYTGETTAEVVVWARLADPERAYVRLMHRDGEKTIADYRVYFTSTEQPFGGRRWWFVCPSTGARVATIHMPRGATFFASRQAYRLGYHSQRSSPRGRALHQMHKMTRKLGGDPGSPFKAIEKPLRMRWETFDRKLAELKAAEAVAYGYMRPIVEALQARIEKGRRSARIKA